MRLACFGLFDEIVDDLLLLCTPREGWSQRWWEGLSLGRCRRRPLTLAVERFLKEALVGFGLRVVVPERAPPDRHPFQSSKRADQDGGDLRAGPGSLGAVGVEVWSPIG